MKVSENGINLIKEFEGCYLESYQDSVGVWTIGYGITNSDRSITNTAIRSGLYISQATADKWLRESLDKIYVPKVMKYDDTYHWTQNQLDALVSFAYNIGSIDQLTADGSRSISEISSKILAYNKAGGRVLNGLTRRRKAEKELFDRGATGVTTKKKGGNPYTKPSKAVTSKKNAKKYNLSSFVYKGETVKWVQWNLMNLKNSSDKIKDIMQESGGIDGFCGDGTVKAIKKYQKKHNLEIDGIAGRATFSVMK